MSLKRFVRATSYEGHLTLFDPEDVVLIERRIIHADEESTVIVLKTDIATRYRAREIFVEESVEVIGQRILEEM